MFDSMNFKNKESKIKKNCLNNKRNYRHDMSVVQNYNFLLSFIYGIIFFPRKI